MKAIGRVILAVLSLVVLGCGELPTEYFAYDADHPPVAQSNAPAQPDNLEATIYNGQVCLGWGLVNAADYYVVSWFSSDGGKWVSGSISTSETSFTQDLPAGVGEITYTVISVSQSGDESSPGRLVLTVPVLASPQGTVTQGTQGGSSWSWSWNSGAGFGTSGASEGTATGGEEGGVSDPLGTSGTETGLSNTAGGSNTVPAVPADPGVNPAIPALPNQAQGDPAGGNSIPEPEPVPVVSEPKPLSALAIGSKDGVMQVSLDGTVTKLHGPCYNGDISSGMCRNIEVFEGRLFVRDNRKIVEVDSTGQVVGSIDVPSEAKYYLDFLPMPLSIALLDNWNDKVYFMDWDGNYLGQANIQSIGDSHLQNVHAIYHEGKVLLSEDGDRRILSIDPVTFEVSVFKDLYSVGSWLNVLGYHDGLFYITTPRDIYSFTEGSGLTLVASLTDEYNITGLVLAGDGYAYVSVNFAGKIYKVDLSTGKFELVASGLNYPTDMAAY